MTTSHMETLSASQKPMDESHAKTAKSAWRSLYRVGGAAALIAAGLEMAAALIAVISSYTSGPAPGTVIGWFTLLQNNRFLGLVDLGLFDIAAVALLVPVFLAMYIALRRANESYSAVATTLAFIGIAAYLATETAFSMLSLSDQYAAATTDAQRSLFLAAGQAMLAEQVGAGTGTYMAFILIGVAGLIIATVMLRSKIFGKVTASVGILANGITLAYYIGLPFVSMRPSVLIYSASGLVYLIWIILIGRQLFQLAQGDLKEEAKQPAVA